jgi:Synaptobrevin
MRLRLFWYAVYSFDCGACVVTEGIILQHKTIESVLQRGEKLDNLVERSNALSMQSKAFYKTAKKVRSSIWFDYRLLTGVS